jgi:ATP-binding cassette, subfamily B, bacterial
MFRLAAAGRSLHHNFADKAATVDGEMSDVISNLPVVRAFGGVGREHRRFDATLECELGARRRSLIYLEKLRIGHAITTIGLTIGLLAWGIVLWQRGKATTGEVVLVCTLGLSVLHATRDLAVALVDVTQHLARLSEALETLLVPHAMCDHPDAVPFVHRGARVEFANISFGYSQGSEVLADFNLKVAPNERVGLIGRSGGGKSTLFALLQRNYEPQGGRICIDGQDISRLTQESLRAALSIVPQDVCLFNRTIMENIRYGRPDASDEEVWQAVALARCDDFIRALPDGFLTMVGDRGLQLSGGQRQRIAIARAFLKDAPILLLDEATSTLDIESEEAIREALESLMRRRTVIAIAHRLSTLRSFDRIVVLHNGRIEQDGPPDLLIGREGPYRRLMLQEINRLSKAA